MLSCKELANIATDYLEGDTSLLIKLEIRMHLMICHNCRAYLRRLPQAIQLIEKNRAKKQIPSILKKRLENDFKTIETRTSSPKE